MSFYPEAPSSGGGQQAWQFRPETYGAVGNGVVISDLVLNGTTTATSASANFTSADTGKTIMINGGTSTTSGPLVTTITFVNATTVTLGSAAGVSGSAFVAVYGTDDTAAINSCISAAKTYAITAGTAAGSGNYLAEILFSSRIYMLTSAPTQTTSPAQYNAQIPVPYANLTGNTPKLVIELTGAGDAGWTQFFEGQIPNLTGSVLVSTQTAPVTPSGTFGQQSVIGGPSAGGAFTGGFANVKVVVKGIEVVCGALTNQYAYDFAYLSGMRMQQSSAHIFAPTGNNGGNAPTLSGVYAGTLGSTIGTGLRSPVQGNNAEVTLDDVTCQGYANTFLLWDHATCGMIKSVYSVNAVTFDVGQGNSGLNSRVVIDTLDAEAYQRGILLKNGAGGTVVPVTISASTENTGAPIADVSDAANNLSGVIRWVAPTEARNPTVSGGVGVNIINDNLGPGIWAAAPGAPGTGVAQQNTAWRNALVYVTSTAAISAIAIGPASGTLTTITESAAIGVAVTVKVPAGWWYSVTSATGTLTTHWVLD